MTMAFTTLVANWLGVVLSQSRAQTHALRIALKVSMPLIATAFTPQLVVDDRAGGSDTRGFLHRVDVALIIRQL